MTSEPTLPSPPLASSPVSCEAEDAAGRVTGDCNADFDRPHLSPGTVVAQRYRITDFIAKNGPVERFRGLDLNSGQQTPLPVVLVVQSSPHVSQEQKTSPHWPGIEWEKRVLARAAHLSLPRVLDSFDEAGLSILVEELPEGRSFWDAWDEEPLSWPRRCAWLIQLAEALDRLNRAGALVELSPDRVVISPMEQAVIADLSTLLPLPIPGGELIKPGRHTAPELIAGSGVADARAALYSFGAMVHSLLLGRELTDFDFTPLGRPRAYVERFPDAHPLLGRLLGRTFAFDVDQRFPAPDRLEQDPGGTGELIELLQVCAQHLDSIHLEISAWTSTGLIRSGNEDAVAVLHSAEAQLEEHDDRALLILADGMGGMAGGEVAAAMTTQTIRDYLVVRRPFAPAMCSVENNPAVSSRDAIRSALGEANRVVLQRSLEDESLRGMGCTAEVMLIDGRQVSIGHIGDSRTYHYRRGKLVQVTQDQTLVSRLVQLGQLTEDEADQHPQRSELQQAIGGRYDIYPDDHELDIEPGDWLLMCTDGLTNMLRPAAIIDVLQSATSAEKAARRLINQAILAGGSDNVSLIVVRVC